MLREISTTSSKVKIIMVGLKIRKVITNIYKNVGKRKKIIKTDFFFLLTFHNVNSSNRFTDKTPHSLAWVTYNKTKNNKKHTVYVVTVTTVKKLWKKFVLLWIINKVECLFLFLFQCFVPFYSVLAVLHAYDNNITIITH